MVGIARPWEVPFLALGPVFCFWREANELDYKISEALLLPTSCIVHSNCLWRKSLQRAKTLGISFIWTVFFFTEIEKSRGKNPWGNKTHWSILRNRDCLKYGLGKAGDSKSPTWKERSARHLALGSREKKVRKRSGGIEKRQAGTPELEREGRRLTSGGGRGWHPHSPCLCQRQFLRCPSCFHTKPSSSPSRSHPKRLNGQLHITDAFLPYNAPISKYALCPLRSTGSLHLLWGLSESPCPFSWVSMAYCLILLFLLCPLLFTFSLTPLLLPHPNFLEHRIFQKLVQNRPYIV